MFDSWSKRISVVDECPQGDDPTKMTFGIAVFTEGLQQNDKWMHYDYQNGDTVPSGNDNAVGNMSAPLRAWPARTRSTNWASTSTGSSITTPLVMGAKSYSILGTRGARITTVEPYPQGDAA